MPDAETPPGRIGEFEIGEQIGESPRATIYAAKGQGQDCAVKVLKKEALPKSLAHRTRLVQVLQRLAELRHDTVVAVLAAGDEEGKLYVAMERMMVPNLADRLAAGMAMTERDVVMMARQVAQALEAGQSLNMPHGNVGLSNIWPCPKDRYKLGDFAVKKYISEVPREAELQLKRTEESEGDDRQSAEDLLRSRSQSSAGANLQRDIASLASLMLALLGTDVAPQGAEEGFEDFRDRVQEAVRSLPIANPSVSAHTANAMRHILTPTACRTAGAAVVELASAMVFQRRNRDFVATQNADHAAGAVPTLPEQSAPTSAQQFPPAQQTPAADQMELFELPEENNVAPAVAELAADETAAAGPIEKTATQVQAPAADVTTFFVLHREGRGEFFTLAEGQSITIGRDPDLSEFTILDGSVSRRHCTISKQGGVIRVKDEGSSNGVFVRDKQVQEAEAAPGDVIRIGHCQVSVGVPFPS